MPPSIVGWDNGQIPYLRGALVLLFVASGCVGKEERPRGSDDPSPATDDAMERAAEPPEVPLPSAATPEMLPPPEHVSWERPAADAVLGAREVRIEGTVPPGARVRLGDSPWIHLSDVRFSLPTQLTEGDNRLILEAAWKEGSARFERHVYYVDAAVIEKLQIVADTQRQELADLEAQSRELRDEIELIGGIFPILPPASRDEAELLARELSAEIEDIAAGCAELTDDVERASVEMAGLRQGLRASPP